MIKDHDGHMNCHPDSEPAYACWCLGRPLTDAVSLMMVGTGPASWFRAAARSILCCLVSGTCRGLVTKPGCTVRGVMQAQGIMAAQHARTKALSDRICTEIRRLCLLHDESLRLINVQLWCFVQHNLTEKAYRGIICAAAIC